MFDVLMTWPWWVFCLILTLGSACYGVIVRFSEASVHPSLFAVYFNGVSTTVLGALVLMHAAQGIDMPYTGAALVGAVFSGLCLVVIDISIITMYRRGAPVSLGMPLVRVMVAILTVAIGLTIFHESLTLVKVLGIVLGCAGIALAVYEKK